MSDSYETTSPSGSDAPSTGTSGKVDAAKQEAADLKDTAASQAKDVLGTAKDEAATVVEEAKLQAKDLYSQTQKELKEQTGAQQQRLAAGLRGLGDDLGTMASSSQGSGIASDLVQQVSTRLSRAGTWLSDRDPSSVLDEVKRFARQRPGTFILGAAVAGIVIGRLTRALAANASDEKADTGSSDGPGTRALPPAPAPALIDSDPREATPVGAHNTAPHGVGATPVYAQTASSQPDILGEDGDERSHTV